MLSHIRERVARRREQCRRIGHQWTDMSYPPACTHCGRCRPH
jgi:hypothetical protein